jgi:hypothetical protein
MDPRRGLVRRCVRATGFVTLCFVHELVFTGMHSGMGSPLLYETGAQSSLYVS